jgi:hypothetical protein
MYKTKGVTDAIRNSYLAESMMVPYSGRLEWPDKVLSQRENDEAIRYHCASEDFGVFERDMKGHIHALYRSKV